MFGSNVLWCVISEVEVMLWLWLLSCLRLANADVPDNIIEAENITHWGELGLGIIPTNLISVKLALS